jgi:hypothetical protein
MIKKEFADIISLMNRNDNFCQGASQQMTNGFYRIFEALKLIVAEVDEKGIKKSTVASISNLLERNNSFCQGAPQQCANGSYRIAELLEVFIELLDTNKKYSSEVKSIINTMNRNNSFCQGAPQQTANGSYRIVELLEILVKLVAPLKTTSVASYISAMNRNNSFCQGAPQQSANGTDAAFWIVQDIVKALDDGNKYTVKLATISTLKDRNNGFCQGADQQSANNLYRIMETIQVLGDIIHDKNQARIDLYWKEHADRYNELIAQKKENEEKIKEIKKQAAAVNADADIGKLNQEKNALVNKKNACGAAELAAFAEVVQQRQTEYAQIGFFKFALRKEAAARVEEAKSAHARKIMEVEEIKNGIQHEIDGVEARISAINADIERKKKEILKGCNKHNASIAEINNELTKKR